MEELRDRYDELDNIYSTLGILINEITDKDIIEELNYIRYSIVNEKDELEERIADLEEQEEREMNRQYERSSL